MMDDQGNQVDRHLSDTDIDRIVSRLTGMENHADDHRWIAERRASEKRFSGSRRKIVETILGGVGTAAILGFFAWFGHLIYLFATELLGKGVP